MTMPSILFVCTGNLCRSPMAAGLFQAMLARAGLEGWTVGSAGTWTVDGEPATPAAVQVLARKGIDITGHRSRQVTGALLEQANLVLVMTRAHAEAIRAEFPGVGGRVRLLSEMSGAAHDIPDPIGRPLADYQITAAEIERLLAAGFDRIRAAAGAGG